MQQPTHGHVGKNPRVKRTFCSRRPRTSDRTVSHIKVPFEMSQGPPHFNLVEYLALGLLCPFNVIKALHVCQPDLFLTHFIKHICDVVTRSAQKLSICFHSSIICTTKISNFDDLRFVVCNIPNMLRAEIGLKRDGNVYALTILNLFTSVPGCGWVYWQHGYTKNVPLDQFCILEERIERYTSVVCSQFPPKDSTSV